MPNFHFDDSGFIIPKLITLYFHEQATFTGNLIGSILYGMLVVLFFKCMAALFNPVYCRGGRIKWGLVSYTVIMFSFATVYTAMNLNIQSSSDTDNREYPVTPPAPLGYQSATYFESTNAIPNTAFALNGWLAAGLLLYRCYVIYSRNPWVIAFPCLMYVASVAMGIVTFYPVGRVVASVWLGLPYFSILLSLYVLLALMIAARLVLHDRNVRTATESPAAITGFSKTITTMLIESSAILALSSLLVIGPLAAGHPIVGVFFPILTETQVIAPLLIIQRVADKSALTSDAIVSGSVSSLKTGSQEELTSGNDALGGYSMSSEGKRGINSSGKLGVVVETAINFHRDVV